jgi:hypothetical protein
MKKILVVLLILAVAGGVFAQQGEWSLGGSVEFGTRLDFNPNPDPDWTGKEDPALVDGIAYWDWDQPRGLLDIGYDRGIAHVGIRLNSKGEQVFDVAFNGDDFRGQFKINDLSKVLQGDGNSSLSQGGGNYIDRLWGEYKFVNGMITVLGAVASPDTEYWTSDLTGTFANTALAGQPKGSGDTSGAKDVRVDPGLGSDQILEDGWKGYMLFGFENHSFTKVDHHNYLLIGADVGALGLGVIIPNLFIPMAVGKEGWDKAWRNGNNSGAELLAHALPYTVLGVSFNQSPLEIAAQFNFKTYGVYFGGRFFAGPVTVGLSFTGVLDGTGYGDDYNPKQIKIGGRVDYNGGAFGGGIKGFYGRDEVDFVKAGDGDTYRSIIGIEPTFFFNAIPSHLRFDLDLGMYFHSIIKDTPGAESKDKAVVWAVQPQVFWNFLGTGATDNYWGGFDTGVIFRYRLAVADFRDKGLLASATPTTGVYNYSVNFVDIIFKLSF